MTKPKIICTLGYTTDGKIEDMIKAGMRGARINGAYCTLDQHIKRIREVKEARKKLGKDVPIIVDIKGPQLRIVTDTPGRSYSIETGMTFPIGYATHKNADTDIYLNHDVKQDLKVGDILTIENGSIVTKVIESTSQLTVQVLDAGSNIIMDNMGANVPGKYLHVPTLGEKDKRMIEFSVKAGIDYIALSFCRDQVDAKAMLDYIKSVRPHADIGTILKIEEAQGVRNLQQILDYTPKSLIMIGRGDLYNEMNYIRLAATQQAISRTCVENGVKVIVATGLIESMKHNRKPTRAEIGDVWNALRDNPDYLMLSAETSNSEHPVLAVATLQGIIDQYYAAHR